MQLMTSLRIAVLAAGALALSACASLEALPSVGAKENSPRTVGLVLAKDFGAPLDALAEACEGGLVSDSVRDIVTEYGPTIRQAVGLYASTARACVVLDGNLVTDPASGGECFRGSVQRASGALPSVLKEAGLAIGGDEGKQLYLAGLVATTFLGAGDGGSLGGWKATDDVPLSVYDAGWAPVQASADRLASCAAALG